jgi:hypothetical protein
VDDEQTVVSVRSDSVSGQATVVDSAGHRTQATETPRDNRQAPLFDLSSAEPQAANNLVLHVVPDNSATDDSQLRDVIGTDGGRVSLATAQADSTRYYVNQVTGQIWSRAHWESLNGTPAEPEAKAA